MKYSFLFSLILFYSFGSLAQTSLWSNSFNSPSDWVIGGNTAQGDWVIDDTSALPNPSYYTVLESSSGGNIAFFEGLQYVLAGNTDNQDRWIEMANSVDLSAYAKVNIVFEQEYRAFNTDYTYVEVSLDGGNTWQQQTDANPNVAGNTQAEDTIKYLMFDVNNSPNVKFRFRWVSMQANGGYAWQIDDVHISTVPNNDVETTNLYYGSSGLHYFQIPETQVAPIDITVNVENKGLSNQTGVALEATETLGSGYSSTSPLVSLPVSGTDSLVVSNSFTPPGQGTFNIDFALLNDATDDVPVNNSMESYSFEVGPNIYARDEGNATGSIAGTDFTPSTTIEMGNQFEIFAPDDLYAIDAVLGDTIAQGIDIYGTLYEIDPNTGDFLFIDETEYYTTGANDANTSVSLSFVNPQSLDAGKKYLVTVSSFSTDFSVSISGNSPNPTSFVYGSLGAGGTGWYYMYDTPMVRMNFDPCAYTFDNLSLAITDPYCIGSCDALVEDADPFSANYVYEWYDNTNNLIHTGQQLTNLCPGDYSVTKTDVNCGGSTDQLNFTIDDPNSVVLGNSFNNQPASNCLSADGVINMNINFASSFSSSNITIEASGPSNETINTAQSANYSIPNLLPGNYTVTVTDNENGCDPWVFNTTISYDLSSQQSICVVTVDSSNTEQNIVVWEKPVDLSFIDSFFVYREVTANNYQKIGAVHVDSLSQFKDTSANPNAAAYRYKVSILDACGQELDLSPYHTTIHLQFQANGSFNWNHYQIEGLTGIVDSYNFYKDPQSDGNWQILDVIPGSQNTYTDLDFSTTPNASYFVDVNWAGGSSSCTPTKAQDYNSSRSNELNAADASLIATSDPGNIIIHPNPTSGVLYIENIKKLSEIQIINSLGQIVYQSNSKDDLNVDVSSFRSGVYLIRIRTHNGVLQKRFVKN